MPLSNLFVYDYGELTWRTSSLLSEDSKHQSLHWVRNYINLAI